MESLENSASFSTTSLNSVESVTATADPGVYIVRCNITDVNGETYDTNHGVRPDDPYGLSPILRAWMVENEGSYEVLPYIPPVLPEPVTIVYPVDLWSRMSDGEAEQVETAMLAQPIRIQNIFRTASSYRSDHELWPLLTTIATTLFGAERAAEILAAS